MKKVAASLFLVALTLPLGFAGQAQKSGTSTPPSSTTSTAQSTTGKKHTKHHAKHQSRHSKSQTPSTSTNK